MLSPLHNGNVANQVYGFLPQAQSGAPALQGPQGDQTRFSPELLNPMGLSPVADMNGLLNGLRGLTEPDPSQRQQKQQPQQPRSAEQTRQAQLKGNLGREDKLAGKRLLTELDSQELQQLYGELGPLMGRLGAARPEVTLQEAAGIHDVFKDDANAAHPVVEFLSNRKDVKLSETFTSAPGGGRPELEPSLKDESSRQMLMLRRDLKPRDASKMGSRFQFALGDPMMAADAYKSTVPMLAKRNDIHPETMSNMMDGMVRTMGEPAAALRTFKSGTRLMEERGNVQPTDVSRLLGGVANLSKKDGGMNPARVANAFEDATNLLREQPGRSIQDVISFTDMLGGPGSAGAAGPGGPQGQAPGQPGQPPGPQAQAGPSIGTPSIGGKRDRLSMFQQGLALMRSAPDLNAQSVHALVTGQPAGAPGTAGPAQAGPLVPPQPAPLP
ncbi:hypothetical protein DYH09_03705 [bacterium CPR1]|nr:hypothetical protein [bacterium CPR1]